MIGVLSFIFILVMIKELIEVSVLILGYSQNERRLQSQLEISQYLLLAKRNGPENDSMAKCKDGVDSGDQKGSRIPCRYGFVVC